MADKKTQNKSRRLDGLRWNGQGSLNDVPARDLTHAEVIQFGGYDLLLRSGVYEEVEVTEARVDDHKEMEK